MFGCLLISSIYYTKGMQDLEYMIQINPLSSLMRLDDFNDDTEKVQQMFAVFNGL